MTNKTEECVSAQFSVLKISLVSPSLHPPYDHFLLTYTLALTWHRYGQHLCLLRQAIQPYPLVIIRGSTSPDASLAYNVLQEATFPRWVLMPLV